MLDRVCRLAEVPVNSAADAAAVRVACEHAARAYELLGRAPDRLRMLRYALHVPVPVDDVAIRDIIAPTASTSACGHGGRPPEGIEESDWATYRCQVEPVSRDDYHSESLECLASADYAPRRGCPGELQCCVLEARIPVAPAGRRHASSTSVAVAAEASSPVSSPLPHAPSQPVPRVPE